MHKKPHKNNFNLSLQKILHIVKSRLQKKKKGEKKETNFSRSFPRGESAAKERERKG